MSAATTTARARWPRVAGSALALAALLFATWVYWGLGPRPKARAWWEPKGSIERALAETSLAPAVQDLGVALGVFGLAALGLAVATFLTTRSAAARFFAVFGALATACFVFYAIEASFVWNFFRWRWSGTLALFAAAIAAAATAPLLAASWLRQNLLVRAAVYLPVVLAVLAYERNVTGTDPTLRFAISPWPFVQIFGLELAGSCLGALAAGVGLGLFAAARARRGGGAALWVAGAAAAAALPVGALGIAAAQDLLPFSAGARFFGLLAAASLSTFAFAALLGVAGDAQRTAARARHWLVGGLLVLVPVGLGQTWARLDYSATREGRAGEVIEALARYMEREGAYPEALEDLVRAGDLREIPRPRVGFSWFDAQQFVYQNFGDSYLLEFSAPRWVQCAYNPPYPEEAAEEEAAAEKPPKAAAGVLDFSGGSDLGQGSWSCPSKPPELW